MLAAAQRGLLFDQAAAARVAVPMRTLRRRSRRAVSMNIALTMYEFVA